MDHREAIDTYAPDRYLLGQLSAAEADAFEEHYFDCLTCAADVRVGMSLMEGGRRLVREEAVAPAPAPVVEIETRRRRGVRWIPAAAAAAVIALLGNVGVLMRMQNAVPRIIVGGAFFTGETRKELTPPQTILLPDEATTMLSVDIAPDRPYERYEARVVRGDEIVHDVSLTPADIADTVNIPLPDPGPGTYDLVIIGLNPAGETEIVRHQFEVKRPNKAVHSRRERWLNLPIVRVHSAQAA
jgi:Putative zinc-finger